MNIYGIDKKGNKIKYDVIMTFKGSNDYVIYTDNSVDENDCLRIYSAIYDPKTSLLVRNVNKVEELEEIKQALKEVIV